MGTRKRHEGERVDRPPLIISLLLLFPIVLISIGDAVRLIIRIVTVLGIKSYNIITSLLLLAKIRIAQWHISKTLKGQTKPKQSAFFKTTPPTRPLRLQTLIPNLRTPYHFFLTSIFRAIRVNLAKEKKGQIAVMTPKVLTYTPYRFPVTQKVRFFSLGILSTVIFVLIPYTTHLWLKTLPNPQLLSQRSIDVSTKIFDRNGVLLYEIYANENRTPQALAAIPPIVQKATIAIEDKDFYLHQGFSFKGIIRAAKEILINKKIQGGSTITQQLIKSALLNPEVKLSRKMKEIILAFWAERIYTKNQILEMYLNQVPYGGTAWGIEAASQTYFGKSVSTLTLAEAALLTGLPAAPSKYSPFGLHPQKAFERQREVLRRMVEDGYISQNEADNAMQSDISFVAPKTAIRAPHFVMYVKHLLEEKYGPRLIERGGLRVKTTLDVGIHDSVQEIIRTHIDNLKRLKVGNGASVISNPRTGEILAMVGSKDYFNIQDQGNVNVATSLRQPGSSIKVVTYAAALEHGFTTATIIDDSPVAYRVAGSPDYIPVNYDGRFHGPVPLRYALGNSYNIPAVKVLAKIGLKQMIEKGRLMGIESWVDERRYGLSLTLGGGEVTMLDMARVYGTMAAGGQQVPLTPILEITDYTGRVIERFNNQRGKSAINQETSWIISHILADNAARTNAFGPNSSLVIPGKTVSVKTGTSNDKRDNWTIGYTPSYVVTVWVGNNDNSPMDPLLTSGITGAAPIWHDIMVKLLADKGDESPQKPDSVVAIPCYFGKLEYFASGTEPQGGRCAIIPPSPTPTEKN